MRKTKIIALRIAISEILPKIFGSIIERYSGSDLRRDRSRNPRSDHSVTFNTLCEENITWWWPRKLTRNKNELIFANQSLHHISGPYQVVVGTLQDRRRHNRARVIARMQEIG
jgi:hypothetical protein